LDHDVLVEALGLVHPSGFARRSVVIGAGVRRQAEDGCADLIVVRPSAREWHDRRWRTDAFATIHSRLAPEGTVFAIPPGRRHRRSMLAAVANSGLNVVDRVALLPDLRGTRQVMPIVPEALEHELLRTAPRGASLGRVLARLPPSTRLLELLLPAVGYVAQRHGSKPPVAWLRPPHGSTSGEWLLRSSWRGRSGAAVVLRLVPGAPRAALVAKVTKPELAETEASALQTIAANAELHGVRTPKLLSRVRLADRVALVEEALEGQPGAVWLARHPERLDPLVATLGGWLEQWAMATREVAALEPGELEESVLARARQLAPMLGDSESYLDWLVELGGRVVGKPLARTAAHQDLTMWNLVISSSGRIGVLDWAEATSRAFPLGDLVYAAVDAVAAVDSYRARPDAFAACFAAGARRSDVTGWLRRLAAGLELSAEAQTLCFHACWLRHAANELEQTGGRPGPFVAILRRLAVQRSIVPGAERK
jgi:hypothetical protein